MGFLDWLFGRTKQSFPPRFEFPADLEITEEFKAALDLLEGDTSPILVTGNAGTGKSTLLQLFRARTEKNIVVTAFTGIAALNVRGVTIHSLFKFPLNLLRPENIRINHSKTDVFKKIDAIVIDEISMVRADLLDAIDVSLRLHRANDQPFGGVQVIFFGDICQLPPVVREDALKKYFSSYYDTPFFFSSHVLKETGLHVIELKKVFRQSDSDFIGLLNRVRQAEASRSDMIAINKRHFNEQTLTAKDDSQIVLTTTNRSARQINRDRLDALPPPEFKAEARITGNFNEKSFPTDKLLVLKKRAHIMMVKNNGDKWVNGSLGKVLGWDETAIKVSLPSGRHSVERAIWEVIDYKYDKKKQRIEEFVVGSFEQFPMKLAWAITIHKSQGQTFDKVHIDMDRGAFAHGQLYVALSRCRSFDGIRMITPVALTDLCFDERVRWFIERIKTEGFVSLAFAQPPTPANVTGRQDENLGSNLSN